MRPIGSAEELERRRRQAVEAVKSGESQATVARVLGVTPHSIYRWVRLDRQTADGLAAKHHPGPKRLLSLEQDPELERLLLQGAQAHGWSNDLWTAVRVTEMIQRHFGIDYHVEHVRHILKDRLGWSSQRPEQKARERNEAEIERWTKEDFPRIKKRSPVQRRSYRAAG
jgi:transposase